MALSKPIIKAAIIDCLSQPFDETTDASAIRNQYADAFAQVIIDAITSATVTVPGTGLVAPPGTAGGPVTGTSTTGTLS